MALMPTSLGRRLSSTARVAYAAVLKLGDAMLAGGSRKHEGRTRIENQQMETKRDRLARGKGVVSTATCEMMAQMRG